MRDKFLILAILIGVVIILGCASNTVNTAENNTTMNVTGPFLNITANVSIGTNNYNDSSGLESSEKLKAINVALGAGQLQQYLPGCTDISVGEVLPPGARGKPAWLDSGFFNTSDNIVSIPINTTGVIPMYWPISFVVYVDISNWTIVGVDTYQVRTSSCTTKTGLPEYSVWYHRLAGSTRINHEYATTYISLAIAISVNDTDLIYPIILDGDNFEKFRNGSRYEALQYRDYGINVTKMIDGKTPLSPQSSSSGIAIWEANISVNDRSSAEKRSYTQTNYYLLLQNKAGRNISIVFNDYFPILWDFTE